MSFGRRTERGTAVVLSMMPPASTGAGGALGVLGNGAALAEAGFEVSHVVIGSPGEAPSSGKVSFCGDEADLPRLLRDLAPHVVWVHHTQPWRHFAPVRAQFPHVLLSSDPEWIIAGLRRPFRTANRTAAGRAYSNLLARTEVGRLRRSERRWFREAGACGIVAGWSDDDVAGMRARTGVDVRLCRLAFPDWGVRGAASRDTALLLGHFTTTATRHGLREFFDTVWPAWVRDGGPDSPVHVIGGGTLPAAITPPPVHPKLVWRGFVPDLDAEWRRARALIVPVPTKTGVRTRIVEAWSRGVPVIAHPAAEAGLGTMRAGEHYLAARRPEEWVEHMRTLERDPATAERLARNGRAMFEQEYSATAGAARFGALSDEAVARFGRQPSQAGVS